MHIILKTLSILSPTAWPDGKIRTKNRTCIANSLRTANPDVKKRTIFSRFECGKCKFIGHSVSRWEETDRKTMTFLVCVSGGKGGAVSHVSQVHFPNGAKRIKDGSKRGDGGLCPPVGPKTVSGNGPEHVQVFG